MDLFREKALHPRQTALGRQKCQAPVRLLQALRKSTAKGMPSLFDAGSTGAPKARRPQPSRRRCRAGGVVRAKGRINRWVAANAEHAVLVASAADNNGEIPRQAQRRIPRPERVFANSGSTATAPPATTARSSRACDASTTTPCTCRASGRSGRTRRCPRTSSHEAAESWNARRRRSWRERPQPTQLTRGNETPCTSSADGNTT